MEFVKKNKTVIGVALGALSVAGLVAYLLGKDEAPQSSVA